MEAISDHPEKPDIIISRKVYDAKTFLGETHRDSRGKESAYTELRSFISSIYRKLASCSCSAKGFFSFLTRFIPILHWLPKYSVKEDLFADVNGGVSVGIMHVPQGNAGIQLIKRDRRSNYLSAFK